MKFCWSAKDGGWELCLDVLGFITGNSGGPRGALQIPPLRSGRDDKGESGVFREGW